MQEDGNLVLAGYDFSEPGYWYTSTNAFNNVSLMFNTSSFLYFVNSTKNIYALTQSTPTPVRDYYHRATIGEYGNFQQNAYHKRNGSRWTRVWRAVEEPCRVNAVYGIYGMCTSPDNESVICTCIPGHIPFDPTDVSKGYHPETVVNYCASPSLMNFKLNVIDDADFQIDSTSDLALVTNVDVEGCQKSLMNDCYAIAASLDASISNCNMKRTPLINARKSASSKGLKALIKIPSNINNSSTGQSNRNIKFKVRLFLKVSIAVSATLACFFGAIATYYHPVARRLKKRKKYLNTSSIGINFREFSFEELRQATDGFCKILGRGFSGKVYSGMLSIEDAEIAVEVKRLEKGIEKREDEFMTELKIIGRTHHKNLVRLLVFCIENNHRILVYELMPGGALSSYFVWTRRETQMESED
ncbi:S-locus lectin kinase family protein [Quillaja saponaria]|uniref:non-specific serine/threonine protein kinase n=1 Tax=Quillaja saponaria TaxID=32244 RepID=A0AAD7QFT0_QUISA|nr:S-locus lectin kinase family protein [Quillaja saponaria]